MKKRQEAPTVAIKQQKKTLGAKKSKKSAKSTKNVLALPHNIHYKPELSENDLKAIVKCLEINLPRVRRTKVKVPWKDIKLIPKDKRKEFREHVYLKECKGEVLLKSKEIVFGMNEIAKGFESNSLAAVLTTDSKQCTLVVQNILQLAAIYKIPTFMVTSLEFYLQIYCGVKSSCMAIKKDAKDLKLLKLLDCIKELHTRYPFPAEETIVDETKKILCDDSKNPENDDANKNDLTIGDHADVLHIINSHINKRTEEEEVMKRVYLKKISNVEKAFVVEKSDRGNKDCNDTPIITSEFMEFKDDGKSSKATKSNTMSYKNLVVRKLKGDPNRSKRKTDLIKKKKKRN